MPRSLRVPLTVSVALLHALVAVPQVVRSLPYIVDHGVWGGIALGTPTLDAAPSMAALFSALLSVELLMIAVLVRALEAANVPVPSWIAAGFVLGGIVGAVLMPVSGFWMLVGLGVYYWRARDARAG